MHRKKFYKLILLKYGCGGAKDQWVNFFNLPLLSLTIIMVIAKGDRAMELKIVTLFTNGTEEGFKKILKNVFVLKDKSLMGVSHDGMIQVLSVRS